MNALILSVALMGAGDCSAACPPVECRAPIRRTIRYFRTHKPVRTFFKCRKPVRRLVGRVLCCRRR